MAPVFDLKRTLSVPAVAKFGSLRGGLPYMQADGTCPSHGGIASSYRCKPEARGDDVVGLPHAILRGSERLAADVNQSSLNQPSVSVAPTMQLVVPDGCRVWRCSQCAHPIAACMDLAERDPGNSHAMNAVPKHDPVSSRRRFLRNRGPQPCKGRSPVFGPLSSRAHFGTAAQWAAVPSSVSLLLGCLGGLAAAFSGDIA